MSQPTSREGQRDRLLEAALVHVPFDGWSRRSLFAGAADLGLEPGVARRLFPGAGDDMLVHLERWANGRCWRASARSMICAYGSASRGWCAPALKSWVPIARRCAGRPPPGSCRATASRHAAACGARST